MVILSVILNTMIVLIAVLLIGLVLIQPSKGGGFGSSFGGVGESVFGAQAMGHLAKLIVILLSVFFVLTLAFVVISGHMEKPKSVVGQQTSIEADTAKAPAAVAAPVKDGMKPAAATPAVPVKAPAAESVAAPAAPAVPADAK